MWQVQDTMTSGTELTSSALRGFLISSFSALKIRKRKIFLTCTTREERQSVGSPLFDLRVNPTSTTHCKNEPAFCSKRRHKFSLSLLLLQRGLTCWRWRCGGLHVRSMETYYNHMSPAVNCMQSFIIMAADKSATLTLHLFFFRNNSIGRDYFVTYSNENI